MATEMASCAGSTAWIGVGRRDRRDIGARRVPPDRVGGYDGVARPLVDRIGQPQCHAARRSFEAVRLANVLDTLVVVAERDAPFGLDRTRRRLCDAGQVLA